MRNIVVSEFVSLDNVMQAPGGAEEDTEGGFTHGGWTGPFWHDDIGAHFFEAMSQSDALLLGRKTWQIHGGAFEPMPAGDPFGDAMNTMPKYVVSTTLTTASAWRNSTLISSNVVEEVRTLKAQPGKNIVIDGSSVLVHKWMSISYDHAAIYALILRAKGKMMRLPGLFQQAGRFLKHTSSTTP